MQDMWSQMKPVYQELVKNPPTDKALCPCVKDVHNNGVFHNLQGMSQGKGSALIGDPDAEYVEMSSFNSTAVQNYWMNSWRTNLLRFYDDDVKVYNYGAAMFIYCQLNE